MQISTTIHLHAGDKVSFRRPSTEPSATCWLEFGDAGLFGDLPELIAVREALDEMIAAKQAQASKRAA